MGPQAPSGGPAGPWRASADAGDAKVDVLAGGEGPQARTSQNATEGVPRIGKGEPVHRCLVPS